ncbi:MAG: hypothetical protein U0470_04980 [Anaerolineae bacterium]
MMGNARVLGLVIGGAAIALFLAAVGWLLGARDDGTLSGGGFALGLMLATIATLPAGRHGRPLARARPDGRRGRGALDQDAPAARPGAHEGQGDDRRGRPGAGRAARQCGPSCWTPRRAASSPAS